MLTSTFAVPPAGLEPAAYRLGGGRSIHLSYEGMARKVDKAGLPPCIGQDPYECNDGASRRGGGDQEQGVAGPASTSG
jgi:hypothetical protein